MLGHVSVVKKKPVVATSKCQVKSNVKMSG
jgi:hypothetical protein